MWELSPSLVRHDAIESTSVDIAAVGLKAIVAATATAKVTGAAFQKPISNFYQTDPISRAYVHRASPIIFYSELTTFLFVL